MNTTSVTTTPATFSQTRQRLERAQSLVAATEGRELDFETSDELNRLLLTSIKELTPVSIITPAEEFDDFTDEEILELEARLSRAHDDAAYWKGASHV